MNYRNCDVRLSLARAGKKAVQLTRQHLAETPGKLLASKVQTACRRRRMPKGFIIAACSVATIFGPPAASDAALATWSSPAGDRWLYPNGSDLGTRTASPLFGSLGSATSDEKIGTLATIFTTSSLITPGLGASNYLISSITLTLTVSGNQGSASYDGTYDSYRTLLPAADSNSLSDSDVGRPIELYGAGFRNGFTAASFAENSPYGPGGADKGTRNMFPISFNNTGTAVDASNNVSAAVETTPFAIGQTTLTPGAVVTVGTNFTFTLNLANPFILAYAQNALNDGILDFVFTSLAAASQPGEPGTNAYLSFYNKENLLGGPPASLAIDYAVAPEPGSLLWLATAGTALALLRHRNGLFR